MIKIKDDNQYAYRLNLRHLIITIYMLVIFDFSIRFSISLSDAECKEINIKY
jgi:hypothetical protein